MPYSDKTVQRGIQNPLKAAHRLCAMGSSKGLWFQRLPLREKVLRQKLTDPDRAKAQPPPRGGPERDSSPQQRFMTSEMPRGRVLHAVAEDPQAKPIDLVLAVADRVVFLDGFVQTLQQRRHLARIAAREAGVAKVINRLKVVAPPGQSDEDIEAELRRALRALVPAADDCGLSVEVRQGVAQLKGVLPGKERRRRIKAAAAAVAGVAGIRDQIVSAGDEGWCKNKVANRQNSGARSARRKN